MASQTVTAATYEIRVMGKLDPSWSDWFDGMKITYQNNETLLTGVLADQAALLGLLTKIGHINLTLLSMHRLERQTELLGRTEKSRTIEENTK